MDCYITYCIGGFLAFDENQNLIAIKPFSNDECVSRFYDIEEKKVVLEEIDIIKQLDQDYETIYIESNKRSSDYSDISNKIKIQTPNKGGETLRNDFEKYLEEFDINKEDLINYYKKLALLKMKKESSSEDKHLIQAINSIDELDESISKLIERIREWYALYFPEMDNIKNNETYIKLISENKTSENIVKAKPDAFLINIDEFEEDNINPEDLEIMNNFAKSIYELQKTRKDTEDYIEAKMDSIAPNLKALVGASLGAKLISHSGGIKRLSTYPSSTVQIMGAEKALFRHLKSGDRPPKYGLIYQHPQVRGAKWWNRGKIARMLASRISLAVRKDVYTKDIDENIYENFLEQVEKIEKENPFPKKTSKRREKERQKSKKNKKRKKKNKRRK